MVSVELWDSTLTLAIHRYQRSLNTLPFLLLTSQLGPGFDFWSLVLFNYWILVFKTHSCHHCFPGINSLLTTLS